MTGKRRYDSPRSMCQRSRAFAPEPLVALVVAPLLPEEPRLPVQRLRSPSPARARSARGTRRRSRPPSSAVVCARSVVRRRHLDHVEAAEAACPPATRISASASCGEQARRPRACRSPGANAGSITSMSKLKNAGASPTRSRTRARVVGRRRIARSSSPPITLEAHLARLARGRSRSRAGRACRPAPSARARSSPSSTARRNGVPWK